MRESGSLSFRPTKKRQPGETTHKSILSCWDEASGRKASSAASSRKGRKPRPRISLPSREPAKEILNGAPAAAQTTRRRQAQPLRAAESSEKRKKWEALKSLQMVLRAIRLVAAEFRLCLLAKGHADGGVEVPGVISS